MKRFAFPTAILTLMAALCLTGAAQAQAPAKPADPALFVGDWTGTIDVAGMQIRIAVHFKLDDKKALTGTMDSIDQGAMGLPLEGMKIEGRTLTFLISGIPGEPTFKGTLDETGKKLAGPFTQNGVEGTFQVAKDEK